MVTGIVTALVLLGMSTHIAIHAVLPQRHGTKRDRLGHLTRHIGALDEARPSEGRTWHAADYRRYFVPAGLRLEQARQVIREARNHEEGGSSV